MPPPPFFNAHRVYFIRLWLIGGNICLKKERSAKITSAIRLKSLVLWNHTERESGWLWLNNVLAKPSGQPIRNYVTFQFAYLGEKDKEYS